MIEINRAFCTYMLRTFLDKLTAEEKRSFNGKDDTSLVWNGPAYNRYYFFEWLKHDAKDPGETFVWEGKADNAIDARCQALDDWLEHHAEKFRRQS